MSEVEIKTPTFITDRYRIEERSGQGGSAIVFRCHDLHTHQTVAVKLLRSGNPLVTSSRARFHREARLAASLNHPNIIRVLDFGETTPPDFHEWNAWMFDTEQSISYLCMEFVSGPTLKQLVRRLGPCPAPWVITIGLQLASALVAAHTHGIIHRDIKPQNVLLLDMPTHVIPKLGDFGIARDLNGNTLSTLTQTGQVLGTPDYLAPEQVMGEAGGKQSDIYALGIVLFELLTGQLPFQAETPLAAASRRMFVDPPRLRATVPHLGAALEDVILHMLRREPAQRLRSADEVIDALEWSYHQDRFEPDDSWPFSPNMLPIVSNVQG